MFTIGDILATIGLFIAAGMVIWGLATAAMLISPDRVQRARNGLEQSPWRTFWIGLAVFVPSLILILVMLNIPNPAIRTLGAVGIAGLLLAGTLGTAGLATLLGDRLKKLSPGMDDLAARSKGLLVVSVGVLAPVIGWFLLLPIVLILSLGATVRGWRRTAPEPQPWPTENA